MRLAIRSSLVALALCSAVQAQSPLTTLFARDNGGSAGGAVYFDLVAGNQGVSIHGIDLNFSETAGTAAGVTVYLRVGTAFGNETGSDWTVVARDDGTAVCAGIDNPTAITLDRSVCVPANATVGVALVAASSVGHDYTGRTGQACVNGCTYSTAELTLNGGTATNTPFSGTPFTPRMVNCNLHYTVSNCTVALPPAIVAVSESVAGSGTLSNVDGTFSDGDFLRWNFDDPLNSYLLRVGAMIMNIGNGGAPPVGSTAIIPGFQQVWGGSTPFGLADVFGPYQVGLPDVSVQVPPGLFAPGDTVRLQGIIIDRDAAVGGNLPVVPTVNTILFTYR